MPPEGYEDEGHVVAPAAWGEVGDVFLPSQQAAPSDPQVQLDLRTTTEGALALVSFTSLERLVEGCGERQAWISVPETEVQRIAEQVGAQVILQDLPLPDEQRHDVPE